MFRRSLLRAPLRALARPASSFLPAPSWAVTDAEAAVRDAAAAWATAELPQARVQRMDAASRLEPALISSLFSAGLMGIEIPEKHGGVGASFMAAVLAIEELSKRDASVAVMADVQNTLVNNVFKKWGSPAVNDFALPLLAGSTVGCFCLSEAGSGSDAFALRTRATLDKGDGHYVISGEKMWITNANEAGLFLVFATVDPALAHRGITCFLAERSAPGLVVGKAEDKLGIRASGTMQLSFDGLRVHPSRVVGKVGEGYKIAIGILNEGRVGIAAQMLGIAQGAFDLAVPYALQRKQFGQAVGEFQGMQHQFAQAATDIEAARALTYAAARLKMEADAAPGTDPRHFIRAAAMAKLQASQVAERTTSKAVEWMGGMGFVRESGVEKFFRDSKIGVRRRAHARAPPPISLAMAWCNRRTISRPPPPPHLARRPFTRGPPTSSSAPLRRALRRSTSEARARAPTVCL